MESTLLTPADIVVIFVLLLFSMLGMMRGFVSEIVGIVAWTAGVAFIIFTFPHAVELGRETLGSNTAAHAAAGVLLFIATFIVMTYGRRAITAAAKTSTINPFDQFLGLLFGLVKGILILSLVYMVVLVVARSPDDLPPWLKNARTKPMFDNIAGLMLENVGMLDDFRNELSRGVAGEERTRSGPLSSFRRNSGDPLTAPPQSSKSRASNPFKGREPERADPLTSPPPSQNVEPLFPEEDIDSRFQEMIDQAEKKGVEAIDRWRDSGPRQEDPLTTPLKRR